MSERVHVRFAGEVIGGSGKSTIGTAAQNERHGMKLGAHVGCGVQRFDSGRAGMIVVKIPGDEFAFGSDGAFDLDDASRAEVSPGEFFLASPNDLDGTAGSAREAGSFDSGVAGVLAAVGRSRVGDDDADICFGNTESVGQFTANTEGPL